MALGFWRIAILMTAGAIGTTSEAKAALYYWSDFGPIVSEPAPSFLPRPPKPRHRQIKKMLMPARESAKPKGPLVIAISIQKQDLKIYDANGFLAETPVSTGMRGHSTPMGVFSVIQKQKFHRSNIYSGAPMPYMQRITWSGVAMHAGVLPGYPASHGCIRMPMAFAVKMWSWTRMGARVVITPGEIAPTAFSHPLLAAERLAQPVTANVAQANAPSVAIAEKPANTDMTASPAISKTSLELRSTIHFNSPDTVAPKVVEAASEAVAGIPDEKKEQAHLPDIAAPKADPAIMTTPKRAGPIAVFVSRKDSKLYVRQNFAPLFEEPISIAPSDRPLGTHVFTARVDNDDAHILHWSVISLPVTARFAERRDEDERTMRKRKITGAVDIQALPVPDSPTEALDRLAIPADVMARITEIISTGSSIVVSDQGIEAGETGEGTDFIVSLR